MAKNGARVYSYLRFSDPRQSTGSSADRQLQYAQRWAAEKNLVLDASLSMRDEGLSAYHQRHVTQGALGVFLRAIEDGRIASGSVLIVEGLDRLSRAEPIQAQAQLAQIINAGITVVTASDGREYNRASLKAQPMDLVYSLLVMIRAHEESDTKSKRVKAAIRRQCEGWQNGTFRGQIRNGTDPIWLTWTGSEWQFVPERVAAVKRALQLYQEGNGAVRIVRALHDEGLVYMKKGATTLQIYRLIRLQALRGAKTLTIDEEQFVLEGYYPRLLSESEWADLQQLTGERFRRRGHGEIPGIVTGMGITYCGYCGTVLLGQNIMGRPRKADGLVADGHRRLHCLEYSRDAGCPASGSISVVPIERALLSYCSDQINLQRLLQEGDGGQGVRQQIVLAKAKIEKITAQLDKITDALLADDDAPPVAFIRKARELEAQQAELKTEITRLDGELIKVARAAQPAKAELWSELAERALQQDTDAREKVRQLVMDTFQRIVIYMRGIGSSDRKSSVIDVQLISRTGQNRVLQINRRSGAWVASEDW
ncbi:resolvase domain-containing protein [Pseudomonas sp. StFLB209]|uniref:recombinase family protein n=1 Tax=Pseudomonas sp. StFLB209 TaxID=1028989 RepID=UPI0004F6FEDA|nr:recombinase family protein [Pseudomonas sp. StFLB209]BAP43905.1 resolvase domain-containing protein [Pseudomonas sp. StFLB209]